MTVECRKLVKYYGSFRAVDSVTFSVERGEILGLLGSNGAGKTTILKMLTAQMTPSDGAALIDGIDVQSRPLEAKARFGYVPEAVNLYDRLTGNEFVHMMGVLRGMDDAAIEKKCAEYAKRLDLDEAMDGEIGSYSKGMKQKLALLAAVFHEPPVLILDEPNSGLDPLARKKVKTLIKELAAAKRTILFSTHITETAETLCDRIAVIARGRIVAMGTPADVLTISGQCSLEDAFEELVGGNRKNPCAGSKPGMQEGTGGNKDGTNSSQDRTGAASSSERTA